MRLCLGRRWRRCGIVLLCLFACVSSTGAQSSPRYDAGTEEERTWIARELHDDINQRVAVLTSHLDKLVREFPHENAAMSDALTDLAAVGGDLRLSEQMPLSAAIR